MLNIENNFVRDHLLEGNFGLEKESLRVLEDGSFSHTPHPFPEDNNIVKDFCENQTEINTGVNKTLEGAVSELDFHTERINRTLKGMGEYLWPFSNPSYIKNEEDISIAVFGGGQSSKALYRAYLAEKYGRYKMTFSGIHFNFSFSEDLLRIDYESLPRDISYREYKDDLYLELARRMASYSWILVCVTAASPLLDSSFFEKGVYDRDVFTGMSSVRCSEMGYWNDFAPVFDYSGLKEYVQGIRNYVRRGFLKSPSELYYPVRLKPPGKNNLETLKREGVNHIELRMFDLNPFEKSGVNIKDLYFAHLMMVWLASTPAQDFPDKDQVHAVANFKNAAHYDLKTVKILTPEGDTFSMVQAALNVIGMMREFYGELGIDVSDILDFENSKFTEKENRYAYRVREEFKDGFAKKALALAKERRDG